MGMLLGLTLTLHSWLRWAIVLLVLVVLVKFAIGWARKLTYDDIDTRLTKWLGMLMGIQFLVGLIYMLWSGFIGVGFPAYRWEHMTTLTLAVVAASLPARWKESPSAVRYRNGFISVAVAAVLIWLGVLRVGGW